MMGIGYQHPTLLAFFLCVPLVALFCYCGYVLRAEARKAYGQAKLLDRYMRTPSTLLEWAMAFGWVTVSCLLAYAAAGPYLMNSPERIPTGTVQAVVVLDVSKSMLAEDYRQSMPTANGEKTEIVGPWGSRLDMAKYQIEQIMNACEGNQVGIVNYMGDGFNQAPLTTDYSSLRWVLQNWVKIGNATGGGSNYASGLMEAIKTFQRDDNPDKKKVIVLFSDGGFTGQPAELEQAVEMINKLNIKLVVVGIGTPGANAIPIYQNNQLKGFLTKDDKPVVTSLDEAPLRDLAARTGGTYQHVGNESESQTLKIDWGGLLGGFRVEMRQTPIYHWFVNAAGILIVLLALSGLLSRSRS